MELVALVILGIGLIVQGIGLLYLLYTINNNLAEGIKGLAENQKHIYKMLDAIADLLKGKNA